MSALRHVLGPTAPPLLLLGAAIIAVGLVRAVRTHSRASAVLFGSALALALEFLLAGGILRLSTLRLPALGLVAAVVVVRQIIGRGIRFAERAVTGTRPN